MHAPRQPAPLQRSRGGATVAWLLALALVCAGGLAFLAGGFDALLRSDPVAEEAEADDVLATEPRPAARAVGEPAPSQGPGAAAPADGGSPSSDPVHRNNRAVELLEGGELDEAIELFEQVVSEAPENETYRANLRNALLRRANELTGSDPDAAATDYERALELAADDATRERIAGSRDRARAIASEEKDFVVESTLHFTFRFDGARDEIIGGVDELKVILEAAYQEYGEIFRRRPVEEGEPRIEVVLYRSEGFNAVTGLGDWAGGVFDGTIRVPADDLRDRARVLRLRSVLRHEVAHAFTASIGGKEVPAWLNEGVAQWLEDPGATSGKVRLARGRLGAAGQPLFPLSELQGTLARWQDRARISRAYDQALAFTDYLVQTYGSDLVFEMVAACDSGGASGAAERFRGALLVDLDVVLGDFRDGL